MNIVLLESEDIQSDTWSIHSKRQLQHLREHLDITVGQNLKIGIRNGARYITEIVSIHEQEVCLQPISEEAVPAKIPVHLIVALPRPKVLRRLIMDSVTLGVEKISLIHSYRVDKSYWQTPFYSKSTTTLLWDLSKQGTRLFLKFKCINALSLLLKMSCLHLFQKSALPMWPIHMQSKVCQLILITPVVLWSDQKVVLSLMRLICLQKTAAKQ